MLAAASILPDASLHIGRAVRTHTALGCNAWLAPGVCASNQSPDARAEHFRCAMCPVPAPTRHPVQVFTVGVAVWWREAGGGAKAGRATCSAVQPTSPPWPPGCTAPQQHPLPQPRLRHHLLLWGQSAPCTCTWHFYVPCACTAVAMLRLSSHPMWGATCSPTVRPRSRWQGNHRRPGCWRRMGRHSRQAHGVALCGRSHAMIDSTAVQ